jgi:hypothetical protein
MHKAIKQGCPIRANFIFQYIVGKPEAIQESNEDFAKVKSFILAYSKEDLKPDAGNDNGAGGTGPA